MTRDQIVDLLIDIPNILFKLATSLYEFLFEPVNILGTSYTPITLIAGVAIAGIILYSIIRS